MKTLSGAQLEKEKNDDNNDNVDGDTDSYIFSNEGIEEILKLNGILKVN